MQEFYIGVDPGKKGALAIIEVEDGLVTQDGPEVFRFQQFTVQYMIERLRQLCTLRDPVDGARVPISIWIEKVNAMALGRIATHSMGYSLGYWQAVADVLEIRSYQVKALDWQRAVGLPKKKRSYKERKKALHELAMRRYPLVPALHADEADGVLIAHACMLAKGVG